MLKWKRAGEQRLLTQQFNNSFQSALQNGLIDWIVNVEELCRPFRNMKILIFNGGMELWMMKMKLNFFELVGYGRCCGNGSAKRRKQFNFIWFMKQQGAHQSTNEIKKRSQWKNQFNEIELMNEFGAPFLCEICWLCASGPSPRKHFIPQIYSICSIPAPLASLSFSNTSQSQHNSIQSTQKIDLISFCCWCLCEWVCSAMWIMVPDESLHLYIPE